MPQTLTVGAFVLGAILILIAVLGGRFKIFGAEIRGTVGRGGRIIAGFVGLLILVGLFLTQFHELPPLFSPKVIATNPENGATDVDPSLSEIAVTFSKPMMDKSWSWVSENADSYPKTTGQPYYINRKDLCAAGAIETREIVCHMDKRGKIQELRGQERKRS